MYTAYTAYKDIFIIITYKQLIIIFYLFLTIYLVIKSKGHTYACINVISYRKACEIKKIYRYLIIIIFLPYKLEYYE